jgi:hypothetical protein
VPAVQLDAMFDPQAMGVQQLSVIAAEASNGEEIIAAAIDINRILSELQKKTSDSN